MCAVNQIRKAGESIQMNHLLWNGWAAGRFSLAYLLGNYAKRQKTAPEDQEAEHEDEDTETPQEA